jgi:hypothetical protein
MLDSVWAFLRDHANRDVLAWIGGGLIVVVGGVWAVVKFIVTNRKPARSAPRNVSADRGGVASGGDMSANKITTAGHHSGER